jgi:hypothetical protein
MPGTQGIFFGDKTMTLWPFPIWRNGVMVKSKFVPEPKLDTRTLPDAPF